MSIGKIILIALAVTGFALYRFPSLKQLFSSAYEMVNEASHRNKERQNDEKGDD